MIYLGLDRIINVAYNFLIIIILSRFIDPSFFGDFSVAIGLYQLSIIILDAGMMGAIIKFPSNRNQRSTILQLSLLSLSIFYVILSILSLLKVVSFQNYWFLVSVIVSGYLSIHISQCNARLIRLGKYKRYFFVSILSIIISLLIIIALLLLGSEEIILLVYTLLMTVPAFIAHIYLKHNRYSRVFELDKVKTILNFAFPLFLANLISSLGKNFQFLYLNSYSGTMAGYFFHAEKASVAPANVGVSLIDRMIFSTRSTESKEVLDRLFKQNTALLLLILFAVNITVTYFADVVNMMYETEYIKVIEIIRILAFVIVPLLLTGVERVYFKCLGRAKAILRMDILLASLTCINVVVNAHDLLLMAIFYVIIAYLISMFYLINVLRIGGRNGAHYRIIFLLISVIYFIHVSCF